MKHVFILLGCWAALALVVPARAALPEGAHCIAPAKPGGGFDLTCELARTALQASGQTTVALPTTYLPGGIGAMAFSTVVRQRPGDARAVVAFSAGSLLNLAQGRFGPFTERDVRWVAALGMDHGVIAVRRDAPWATLGDLVAALRRNPRAIVFGAGGTIGSQDWMKAALLARSAGISHRNLRIVAFEGGGDALRALSGRHVQVLCGDAAELSEQLAAGAPLRLLAALSERRLAGPLATVPTALEQGADVRWPILRGVYASADHPEVELAAVTARLAEWLGTSAHAMAVRGRGLEPAALHGRALQERIDAEMTRFRSEAERFGLLVQR